MYNISEYHECSSYLIKYNCLEIINKLIINSCNLDNNVIDITKDIIKVSQLIKILSNILSLNRKEIFNIYQ